MRRKKEQDQIQEKRHSFWAWWWNFRKKVWRFRWHFLTALFAVGTTIFVFWYFKPMVIDTAKPEYHPEDSCSVYIYMCGSNLETRQGLAGKNIDELLSADIPANVNIVLETGGAEKWRSHGISSKHLQRYLVKDHQLVLEEDLSDASMGSAATLVDFLRWGTNKYPADRNVLIFWDHGSSAADGVCYDETHKNDCLTREELVEAFDKAELPKKLDYVIFDTCFMGSLETAYIVEDYAHYMIASQNVVPAGGLDYKFLAEAFPANADDVFGRLLCDAFMDKCRSKKQDSAAQISFLDLAATSALISRFDDACYELHARQKIVDRYMEKKDIEGKENVENSMIGRAASEATTVHTSKVNVVDLVNFLGYSFGLDLAFQQRRVGEAMEKFVLYEAHGDELDNKGVSIYFPVQYERVQLRDYLDFCPIPYYKAILETIYANVPASTLAFADKGSIDEDGVFSITLTEKSRDYLAGVTCIVWKENKGGYSDYVLLGADAVGLADGEPDTEQGALDGAEAELSKAALDDSAEGSSRPAQDKNLEASKEAAMGKSADIFSDASVARTVAASEDVEPADERTKLRFEGRFQGNWYCFEGTPLLTTIIAKEKGAGFTAPVKVNDEDTEYSFLYLKDKKGKLELRSGIVGSSYDEYGFPSRSFSRLKKGDEVCVYTAVNEKGKDLRENEPFTVTKDRQLPTIEPLPEGRYRYQLVATDIYGNSITSNYCIFEIQGGEEERTITATEVRSMGW